MGKCGHKVACKYDNNVLCVRLDRSKDCIRYTDDSGERRSYCKLLPSQERQRLINEKYPLCPHDKLICKKVLTGDDPPCIIYDIRGRLQSVCKRFIAPNGFSIPKQLSPEDISET